MGMAFIDTQEKAALFYMHKLLLCEARTQIPAIFYTFPDKYPYNILGILALQGSSTEMVNLLMWYFQLCSV